MATHGLLCQNALWRTLKSLNYDRNITQFYGACMRPGQDLMLVTEVRICAIKVPTRALRLLWL